jgi:hypothetical protein
MPGEAILPAGREVNFAGKSEKKESLNSGRIFFA